MKILQTSLIAAAIMFSGPVSADSFERLANVIERVCKAPSDKKSSYYKVSGQGEAKLRVSLVGLAGGTADFKREEWDGVQRVLRENQADDNKNFRECSMKLTPLFIEKFLSSIEEEGKKNSGNNIIINGGNNSIGNINQ